MTQQKTDRESTIWQTFREWTRNLKRDVIVLYFAIKHPKTPWYAKVVAGIVVGYALSPIDLIPDFIPVLGYLDDAILIPLGIALVITLMPPCVLAECRQEAILNPPTIKPKNWLAAFIIILLWLVAAYGIYLVVE